MATTERMLLDLDLFICRSGLGILLVFADEMTHNLVKESLIADLTHIHLRVTPIDRET